MIWPEECTGWQLSPEQIRLIAYITLGLLLGCICLGASGALYRKFVVAESARVVAGTQQCEHPRFLTVPAALLSMVPYVLVNEQQVRACPGGRSRETAAARDAR